MRRVNIMPMAGRGKRFLDANYKIPKPLIDINGIPMVIRAARSLPPADQWIFICRQNHILNSIIKHELENNFPGSIIIEVDKVTEGQASTCLLAKKYLDDGDQLIIGACDNEMIYDLDRHNEILKRNDALIWTFRKNISVLSNPKMYGWVEIDNKSLATRVSCKSPISNQPLNDHAVSGTFSFKKAKYFIEYAEDVIRMGKKVNNEYYLDTVLDQIIKSNYRVSTFELKKYFCWGTPRDLNEYIKANK